MRRLLAAALATVALAVSAAPVLAVLLWTLTVTPVSVHAGSETTFSLTATNADLLTELGCLEVDLPASFTILQAAAGSASNGDPWEAVVFPNKVAVHSMSGGGRLATGESITFTIRALATVAGSWTWPNHAHPREDCTGTDEVGAPLAITVLPGEPILSTPTPTATPRPTPTPTPIISLPSIIPTLPPILATPRPDDLIDTPARPASSPTPSVTPPPASGSTGQSPSPAAGASASQGASASDESGRAALAVARPEDPGQEAADVSLGPLGVIDGLTVWAIPGVVIGGPGLLVILWVALQAGVAAAWIPAVRRLRGQDADRRLRPTSSAR